MLALKAVHTEPWSLEASIPLAPCVGSRGTPQASPAARQPQLPGPGLSEAVEVLGSLADGGASFRASVCDQIPQ